MTKQEIKSLLDDLLVVKNRERKNDACVLNIRKVESCIKVLEEKLNPWRPISEAPRDGTWFFYRDGDFSSACFYDKERDAYYGDHHSATYGYEIRKPTHWMPIPNVPERED